MGILYILMNKPFEDRLRKGSILELNDDLAVLHSTLGAWSKDGSLPLFSEKCMFGEPIDSKFEK